MYKSALLNLLAASAASAQLHSLALDAGLNYFGTAMDNGYTSDSDFTAIVDDVNEFGQLVPENGQKWDSTEPSEGSFTYTSADVVPDLAKTNGQILRCHTLTWYSQLPSWVSSGSWTKAQLTSIIQAHISNVVGHFKGDCYAWDVVNEAASDDGGWRSSIFYDTMGTDFLAVSFNAAAEADPDAKLYYNDYNLEYNGAKTNKAIEIVQIIQDAGAPIDGVGFQGHLIVGSTPSRSSLATALRRFTALGLEVAYTELDIRHSSVPASESALETQASDYVNVVGSCLDVEGCVGITVWVFTDKYSWIPDTFSGAGEACLYDDDYNKKPAWTSVSSLLAAAATGSSGSSSTAQSSASVTTVETTAAVETTVASETTLSVETTAAAETTATSETTYSQSVVVSSVKEVPTSIYTPVVTLSTPTTFLTRVNTGFPGGLNSSISRIIPQTTLVVQTTLEVQTTSAASVPSSTESESSIQYSTISLPSNQTIITTIATASHSTHIPVIRHSSTVYPISWSNGTFTTIVSSIRAGTTSVPVPTETETGDDDCEQELVAHYYQCGGRNWDGATECEEPYVCVKMNEWYSQCVEKS